jgi:hypothetical protein
MGKGVLIGSFLLNMEDEVGYIVYLVNEERYSQLIESFKKRLPNISQSQLPLEFQNFWIGKELFLSKPSRSFLRIPQDLETERTTTKLASFAASSKLST